MDEFILITLGTLEHKSPYRKKGAAFSDTNLTRMILKLIRTKVNDAVQNGKLDTISEQLNNPPPADVQNLSN